MPQPTRARASEIQEPIVLLFGNENPQMKVRQDDGSVVSVPAEHLNQSVTRVELRPDALDAEEVQRALSTDNDRVLAMIGRSLSGDDKQFAVALNELEQIAAEHSAGSGFSWVSCPEHEGLERVAAKHFDCARGEPTNLLTNGGRDALHAQNLSTAAQPASFNYMGITTDATAAAAADTTLASEETTNGLGRAQATYAHTAGTNTSTLTKTFTYTGSTSKVLAKIGVFNAAAAGTMGYESLLSSTATLTTSGDNVTVTDTATIG